MATKHCIKCFAITAQWTPHSVDWLLYNCEWNKDVKIFQDGWGWNGSSAVTSGDRNKMCVDGYRWSVPQCGAHPPFKPMSGWLEFNFPCQPLLISPCTIKSRSSLLAPVHPGRPGKKGRKMVVVVVVPAQIRLYQRQKINEQMST